MLSFWGAMVHRRVARGIARHVDNVGRFRGMVRVAKCYPIGAGLAQRLTKWADVVINSTTGAMSILGIDGKAWHKGDWHEKV